MPIYYDAPDVSNLVNSIIESLDLFHIDRSRIYCIRSKGSKAIKTLARIHSFPKIYQKALGMKPIYIIEVISENYDKIKETEKVSVLIHELLHIPKGFSGGLVHHRHNFESQVRLYQKIYRSWKKRKDENDLFDSC
ncbi:MAG: putative metallopeptidase [Thermoproteota archaeon]